MQAVDAWRVANRATVYLEEAGRAATCLHSTGVPRLVSTVLWPACLAHSLAPQCVARTVPSPRPAAMCKWLSGRDLCSVCGQAPPAAHDLPLTDRDMNLFPLLPPKPCLSPLPEPAQPQPHPGGFPCGPVDIQGTPPKQKVNLSLLNLEPSVLKPLSEALGLGNASSPASPHQEVIACPSSPADLGPLPEAVFLFEEGKFLYWPSCHCFEAPTHARRPAVLPRRTVVFVGRLPRLPPPRLPGSKKKTGI